MKSRKNNFGETRLLFKGTPGKSGGVDRDSSGRARVAPPRRKTPSERAGDVGRRGRGERASYRRRVETGRRGREGRETVRRGLTRKEIDLDGILFEFDLSVKKGKLDVSQTAKNKLKARMDYVMDNEVDQAQLERAVQVFKLAGTDESDAKRIVVSAYTNMIFKKAVDKFRAKHSLLEAFVKEEKIKDFSMKASVKKVGSEYNVDFITIPANALSGYVAWEKTKKKPGDSASRRSGETGSETNEDAERKEALARFKKTSIGKMFGMMKDENGDSMLKKIEEGKAPMFILALLGLLGFKELGGGIWEGIRDATKGTKLEANLNSIEKKARGSRFAASKEENRRLAKFVKHNSRQFGGFLAQAGNGTDVPKKGLTLTQAHNFRGAAMKVTLGVGGKMAIPGPANILVDGNRTTVAKGKTRSYSYSENDRDVEIGGTLPKGTRFEGKVTLASVVAEKAKKTKTPRPAARPAARPVAGKPKATPSRTSAAGKAKAKKKAALRRSAS